MSDEVPAAVPTADPISPPPSEPRHAAPSGRRLARRLLHWLLELSTVFVGVYAAFLLNNHATHRQAQLRRDQILRWVEEHYTGVRDNAREELGLGRDKNKEFDAALAAGRMPEIKPVSWKGDYDASDSISVLQSGGYDLLDIATIREMREVESALRQIVGLANHGQQLSDSLILPNLGKGESVFYDPETRKLRDTYAWLPKFDHDLEAIFAQIQTEADKLLVQVRADRARDR